MVHRPLSGPTYTYGLDNSERPITLKDNQSTPVTWVNGVTYGPNNNLTGFSQWNGTAYWAQAPSYNAMFQLTGQSVSGVMGLQYQFSATQNNGKITSKTDSITGETVSYTYNPLNQLSNATSSLAWGVNFQYDGFGNRTNEDAMPGKSGPTADFTYNVANNQNSAYTYDPSGIGNVTQMGSNTYTYDVENRLVSYNSSELYAYGAGNQRIWKKMPDGTEEIYFWTPGGEKLGTYTPTDTLCCSGAYSIAVTTKDTNVYFAGLTIVSRNEPLLTDRMGTPRA